jgi:hypothetical protein
VFGLDKFPNFLVGWDQYLAPVLAQPFVAFRPRLGALVVAAWLGGIIVNLFLIPRFYDVALRDAGLLLAAIALQRLATTYDAHSARWPLAARR